jgi:hypothetical protein
VATQDGQPGTLLDALGVQLFTVPSLTPRLVSHAGLADVLMDCLWEQLDSATGPEGQGDRQS